MNRMPKAAIDPKAALRVLPIPIARDVRNVHRAAHVIDPFVGHNCRPVIARVNGYALGGGNHLAYFCDLTIAADNANFSIAEVRWGLTAAIIVPQLNDAIGVRQMRRYALTGERFGAVEARRIALHP